MKAETANAVITEAGVDLKAIRKELGLSQAALARLVGFSTRAIQSCEQGWRTPGPQLEKSAILLLMAHRKGGRLSEFRCWEVMDCKPERCGECITYRSGQGHLCWYLSGTLCQSHKEQPWEKKRGTCVKCKLFQTLLAPEPAVEAGAITG